MTVDYSRVASTDIRNAIWGELQKTGILSPTDYIPDHFNSPLVPIFPSQQIPEMNNADPSALISESGPGGRIHGMDISKWRGLVE